MDKPKCLRPDCQKRSKNRGLCGSCYLAALKLIKRGLTTWADLEAAGKCHAPRPDCLGRAKNVSPAMNWLLGR